MSEEEELAFVPAEGRPEVSALLLRPPGAKVLYVLGHGAGAGMRHRFMHAMAHELAARDVAQDVRVARAARGRELLGALAVADRAVVRVDPDSGWDGHRDVHRRRAGLDIDHRDGLLD